MERLNLLYRGPLSSCNYDCHYCPFAKHRETEEELENDRNSLQRFLNWLKLRTHRPHGVFFTPWGEALVRRWYRDAIVGLSHQENIDRVVIQTNLSAKLNWLRECDRDRVALWCTYHPDEVPRDRFLRQCQRLDECGIRYSVGVVGLAKHAAEIKAMREALPKSIYLWINALKSGDPKMVANAKELSALFEGIDPLFPSNNTYHLSRGKRCDTGNLSVAIDGEGVVRRCYFVRDPIGNIYKEDLESLLKVRVCPNERCGCHIGYVHMPDVGLQKVFGKNILERIPET